MEEKKEKPLRDENLGFFWNFLEPRIRIQRPKIHLGSCFLEKLYVTLKKLWNSVIHRKCIFIFSPLHKTYFCIAHEYQRLP